MKKLKKTIWNKARREIEYQILRGKISTQVYYLIFYPIREQIRSQLIFQFNAFIKETIKEASTLEEENEIS